MLANLTRLDPLLVPMFSELVSNLNVCTMNHPCTVSRAYSWAQKKIPRTQADVISKGLDDEKKTSKILWNQQKTKPVPLDPSRDIWSRLTNIVTFAFITDPSRFQNEVEQWALNILLNNWARHSLSFKRSIVDNVPIFFGTSVILCSSDWGTKELRWPKKNKQKVLETIKSFFININLTPRNIEILSLLSICALILGEKGEWLHKFLLQLWKKKGKSRFVPFAEKSHNIHHEVFVHATIIMWCLLDKRKDASSSVINKLERNQNMYLQVIAHKKYSTVYMIGDGSCSTEWSTEHQRFWGLFEICSIFIHFSWSEWSICKSYSP